MNELVLKVEHLTKTFGRVTAVDDISFTIYKGDIYGFLGPNGAGKTTTIRMLLSIILPTTGRIIIFNKDLMTHREEILQKVNFSSSYTSMDWRLSSWENLMVFAKLYHVDRPKDRIEKLMKRFEIWQLRNNRISELSSGESTRLNLCKSLINDPDILFLDEPTASLDPYIASKTRKILKDIHGERGLTILYTSHNMAEIEQMCSHILFLNKGKILAQGNAVEISKQLLSENIQKAALEEVFLKVAGNNNP